MWGMVKLSRILNISNNMVPVKLLTGTVFLEPRQSLEDVSVMGDVEVLRRSCELTFSLNEIKPVMLPISVPVKPVVPVSLNEVKPVLAPSVSVSLNEVTGKKTRRKGVKA